MNQMYFLLGDEWQALYNALMTGVAHRAARLHRWTATPVSSNNSPYAIASPTLVPADLSESFTDPVLWAENAFYIAADSRLGKTVYHDAGAFYLQEPSAMAVSAAVAAQPGERVLDLCAAPGGKTTALGRQMLGQGVLVANEIHPKRVLSLAQNVERCGIPAVVVNETPSRLAEKWPAYFDAVLVDAPCSGEGMFRKDEIARTEWTSDAPQMCSLRQQDILTAAVKLVRPGGRLVYSTCTLNPTENERVVAWALQALPIELDPLPDWPGWTNGRPEWAGDNSELTKAKRLWPHLGRGEGHFVARFRVVDVIRTPLSGRSHASSCASLHASSKEGPNHKSVHRQTLAQASRDRDLFFTFASELLTEIPAEWHRVHRHKDLLFAAPPEDLDTSNLKVLRPGLCLAQVKNGRVEPHHALGMAVNPGMIRQKVFISPEDAALYMSGATLNQAVAPGWNLLYTTGDLPLGWGKGVPGRVNNAYPRGLRRNGLLT